MRHCNASLQNDAFKFLSGTLAGHILSHLDDVRNFGCAEMVTTRWRDIVAWWVVEQCMTTMRKNLHRRDRTQSHIAAGNATSGRSLENVNWVVSAGEYVAWAEGPMICSQHLGFQSNGSLYTIDRVNTGGWCDSKPDFWVKPGGYILVSGIR
jgi:hypothetical protein